jgi:ribosomal protein S27AE
MPMKKQYRTKSRCPECGTLTLGMVTAIDTVLVPCQGCTGSLLVMQEEYIFLTEQEVQILFKDRAMMQCGFVVGADYSDRYSQGAMVPEEGIKEQINLLLGEDTNGR